MRRPEPCRAEARTGFWRTGTRDLRVGTIEGLDGRPRKAHLARRRSDAEP